MTIIKAEEGQEYGTLLRFEHSETVWEDKEGGIWFFDGGERRWQNINPVDEGGFWINEDGGDPNVDFAPYTPLYSIPRGL